MVELLSDPAVWASFLSLAILEIILGIDNVLFISIAVQNLPQHQRAFARRIGLMLAMVMRIGLLFSITWVVSLSEPIAILFAFELSWRDIILLGGGIFLIYKSVTEIFNELEDEGDEGVPNSFGSLPMVILQIMVLDLVFSLDSVITAVGLADHVEVMVAAIILAVMVMLVAAEGISSFVDKHPSTKMLALAFLFLVGGLLMADGFHYHVERAYLYVAMLFAVLVEGLNLLRQRLRKPK